MSILRKVSTATALSIAGAGIAVGGVGLASADNSVSEQDSSTQINASASEAPRSGAAMPGERDGRGPGGPGGSGEQAAQLAEALGLDESEVSAAMDTIRKQLHSGKPAEGEDRTRPSEADREARGEEMAAALAAELGVSEQELTDALASLAADRMSQTRSAFADRLDTAVSEGTLSEADKESVLKAFDAGLLGGERGGPHGPGASDDGAVNS